MKKSINIKDFVENNSRQGDLVVLKIEPVPRFCCCSDCVRELWGKINNEIYPQGPIGHEGSITLNIENEQIILEQHESGPEIIAFVNSLIDVFSFIKNLLLSSISAFTKKRATKIKITTKTITTKQKLIDESVFEIHLNQNIDVKDLDKTLKKFLKIK